MMLGKDGHRVAFALVQLPVGEVRAVFTDMKVVEASLSAVDYQHRVVPFSMKMADKVRLSWPFWHFGAKEAVDHYGNDPFREEHLLSEEQSELIWRTFVGPSI